MYNPAGLGELASELASQALKKKYDELSHWLLLQEN
jgi:hypothetical protein